MPENNGCKVIYSVKGLIEDPRKDAILSLWKPKDTGGWWDFVGGKIKLGEDPKAALKRESLEEIDSELVIVAELEPWTHTFPGHQIRGRAYLCHVADPSQIRTNGEHSHHQWVPRANAQDFNIHPPFRPLVDQWIKQGDLYVTRYE